MNSARRCTRRAGLLAAIAQTAALSACAAHYPADGSTEAETAAGASELPDHSPQQREFHYDITAPGRSQDQLWHAATTYFALGMGIDRPEFDTADEDAGIMEGRGLEPWRLPSGGICYTRYAIRFTARDGRVHLDVEALLGESEGVLDCADWPVLPRRSYNGLVADFNRTAEELSTALSAGNGARGSRGY